MSWINVGRLGIVGNIPAESNRSVVRVSVVVAAAVAAGRSDLAN